MCVIFYLILLFFDQVYGHIINQLIIQKCQLDSEKSCHFPRLVTTENQPNFKPIADNYHVIKTVSFKQSSIPFITSDIFNVFPNLKTFNGENIACKRIIGEPFKNATNMEIVRLSENNFTEIKAFMFKGADNITSVSFKYNQIEKIDENGFRNLLELKSLDLGHNSLVTIPARTFKNNRKLEILYINANLLETLEPGLFDSLTQLRWLSLSVNRLHTFSVMQLRNSPNLEILWIYSNFLRNLQVENVIDRFKRLTKFHINDNYFKCDRLEEILTVLRIINVTETMNPYSEPRKRMYVTHKIKFDENSSVDCLTDEQMLLEAFLPLKEELLQYHIFDQKLTICLIIILIITINMIAFLLFKRHLSVINKKIQKLKENRSKDKLYHCKLEQNDNFFNSGSSTIIEASDEQSECSFSGFSDHHEFLTTDPIFCGGNKMTIRDLIT